jgi:hypothetical protein
LKVEELTVIQVVKKLPIFLYHEGSFIVFTKAIIEPYPELVESSA